MGLQKMDGTRCALHRFSPTRAADQLTLELLDQHGGSYTMFDITGQVVRLGRIENQRETLNLNELESGIYLLTVKVGSSQQHERIVIQR